MRLLLSSIFVNSPFEKTLKHADKVAQCGPLFIRAVERYFKDEREEFELIKEEIRDIEAEADKIKQNIRAHLPSSLLMPVEKPVFFAFLREADKVVDCIKNALYWMSYYRVSVPEAIESDFILLAKEVSDYLGFLPAMVSKAHQYFGSRLESDRKAVKDIVREIRWREQQSDDLEKTILIRLCADEEIPPKTFFVMIRLVETTGDIADHLENSADMMRAMVAR
ncbi:MAG: TIGR00153 family protein [Pseudomonadota bacterium]